VATDGNSNVYIGGAYTGTGVSFGNDTLPAVSVQLYSMFLVKYDLSGNLIWVKKGISNSSQVLAVATDAGNNLYVTGNYFGDSVTFDSLTLYNADFNRNLNDLTFLVKYNANGQVQWAIQSDTNTNSRPTSMVTDHAGNVYITGNPISVSSIGFGGISINPNGGFLFKFDPSGNPIWGKGFNDASPDCVAADAQNNVYVGGSYYDTLNLGGTTLHSHALHGASSAFAAKFDPAGNNQWAKSVDATAKSDVFGITTDINRNLYISGDFNSDTMTVDSTMLLRQGDSQKPMFVFGFDSSAAVFCSASLSAGDGFTESLSADNQGNVYLGGEYGGVGVDSFYIGTDSFYVTGGVLTFLSKINKAFPTGIVNPQPATGAYGLNLFPNPFSNQAVVQYTLPADVSSANLIIYNIIGQQVGLYALDATGQVTINAGTLGSGVYLYSLVVNGNVLATKRMVVE
jgi:hypothetical protein